MPETITFHALDLSGETAMKLFLRKNDGTLLNAGGDDLVEISSSGVFAATLGESRIGLGSLAVRVCDGSETAGNLLYDGFLPEGSTTIGQAVELDSGITTQLDAIESDAAASVGYLTTLVNRLTVNAATAIQNLYYMITGSGASSKYTVAALENAPSGTGGDATLAKQVEILTALDELSAIQLAAVEVSTGTISGFPETLTIGDSYSTDTGQIRIDINDSVSGDPIDSLGSLEFADANVSFTAFRPNDSARIVGTCEYVREPSSGTLTASYVLITLLTSETAKGKAEYTYEGRLKFVWQGPSSSDETNEEQKTYKTTPFKFISNP